ncbi:MAG TPA: endolytic transglycosylase MltG [Candidatus Saccharimonadales bacterium]
MKYTSQPARRRWPRRLVVLLVIGIILIGGGTIGVRYAYNKNLQPLSNDTQARLITVDQGASVDEIAGLLQHEKVIRSSWAFRLYVSSKEVGADLKAGSYELAASQSVAEIVSQLTRGKVATNLVTLLPGRRIDQLRTTLIQDGFQESAVDAALEPAAYAGHPALVDKPATATLEGYLYPDSYQKTANTEAAVIIGSALDQMNGYLTPDLRSAFAKQGLSTYQAIILASIVEKEVPKQQDREQVAQVFLSRLRNGMKLESDATASYGAVLAGQKPSSRFDSVYNTYSHVGLPPTPISNVTVSSLKAVAYPADTDWLYFVSGDDGTTHFSKTFAEHEQKVRQFCTKLCN